MTSSTAPELPFVPKHGDCFPIRAPKELPAPEGLRDMSCALGDASRDAVGEVIEGYRSVELSTHSLFGNLELQRSDGGEHRRLITADIRAKHLDDALVVELVDTTTELLVAVRIYGAGGSKMFRRKVRDAGKVTASF